MAIGLGTSFGVPTEFFARGENEECVLFGTNCEGGMLYEIEVLAYYHNFSS